MSWLAQASRSRIWGNEFGGVSVWISKNALCKKAWGGVPPAVQGPRIPQGSYECGPTQNVNLVVRVSG